MVNGVCKPFKQRVYHLGRCAIEQTNGNVSRGLRVVLLDPFVDSASRELSPTRVHPHAIEIDSAVCDVLWASMDELGLVRHAQEREIVYVQVEDV